MPENDFYDMPGVHVRPESLSGKRAVDMVRFLTRPDSSVHLVASGKHEDKEWISLEIPVEVPQRPANNIEPSERLAIMFSSGDASVPRVYALRKTFPHLPHVDPGPSDSPRSLCLYAAPWEDLIPSWTPSAFVARINWWLRLSARGELHAADQALEPIYLGDGFQFVVPADFLEASSTACVIGHLRLNLDDRAEVVVCESSASASAKGVPAAVLLIPTTAQTHGVIQNTPRNLAELSLGFDTEEFRLINTIRNALWQTPEKVRLDANLRDRTRVVFVIALPKQRTAEGPVETVELVGVLCIGNLTAIGISTGAWVIEDGVPGRILDATPDRDGADVQTILCSVTTKLTPALAAKFSGVEQKDALKITAIGVGALGSQVVMNLAREGFGTWRLIDKDRFMPHNAVRHVLGGNHFLGEHKATCVAHRANHLFDDRPVAMAINADFLAAESEPSECSKAVAEADVVVDLSASVSVARALSVCDDAPRCVSAFLTPGGHDLVVLGEDPDRSIRLHDLEMGYYGQVATRVDLADHLTQAGAGVRYGRGCGDISVPMRQSDVALFGGIAAAAIRGGSEMPVATARVWRRDQNTFAVNAIDLPPSRFRDLKKHGWRVAVSEAVISSMVEARVRNLPSETGGVLIGGIDHDRMTIHVVLALPSPPDSDGWPTGYVRGVNGLRATVDQMSAATLGHLNYLGEWHSHPAGSSTRPSEADREVFAWIDDYTRAVCRPPLMMIVGDRDVRLIFDRFSRSDSSRLCLPD